MRRWDRLVDSYMEEYRARGVSPQTIAYTEARLRKWGRWLKGQRPRIGIEDIDAEVLTQYIGKRASFRSKATVSATLSSMREFGDYLVRRTVAQDLSTAMDESCPRVTPYSRLPKRIDHSHMEAMWRGKQRSAVATIVRIYG